MCCVGALSGSSVLPASHCSENGGEASSGDRVIWFGYCLPPACLPGSLTAFPRMRISLHPENRFVVTVMVLVLWLVVAGFSFVAVSCGDAH